MREKELQSKYFVTSTAAVDFFATNIDPSAIPQRIMDRAYKHDGSGKLHSKILMAPEEIFSHQTTLEERGAEILPREGGNLSIGVRIAALLGDGRVRIRSWLGQDEEGRFIKDELETRSRVEPVITEFEGRTPRGLVIPVMTPDGLDRLILSFKQPDMPSDFAEHIPDHLHFAVVNSLYGPDWHTNLNAGITKLVNDKTDYVYTPGSLQLQTVTDLIKQKYIKEDIELKKIESVYNAASHAEVLSLDLSELKTLLMGAKFVNGKQFDKDKLDSAPMEALLKESHKVLGSKVIMVTDGTNGAWGYDSEHDPDNVWHVGMAPDDGVVNTIGAGDAFTAASALYYFNTKDAKKAITAGSVNGACAVEGLGARENLPNIDQLNERINRRGPRGPLIVADGDTIAD